MQPKKQRMIFFACNPNCVLSECFHLFVFFPESNEPAPPAAAGPQRVRGGRAMVLADRELGQLEAKSERTLQTVGQGSLSLEGWRQAAGNSVT